MTNGKNKSKEKREINHDRGYGLAFLTGGIVGSLASDMEKGYSLAVVFFPMADRKIELSNTLALFNLIRILEDWLISRSFLFSIVLLPIDVTVLCSVLFSRFERWFSYQIISGFTRYLHHDLRILREIFLMVVQKDYVSEELTHDPTAGEKELTGKAFKRSQLILRFLWSIVVFLVSFPLLPLFWLWDYLARSFFIGLIYYLIMFYSIPLLLQLFLFSVATFMVAITTVPWIFSAFVYFKSLFELESRSFHAVKLEADTFFLRLYKYSFDDQEVFEDADDKPKGGIYYLFLKTIHGAKDHTLSLLRWIAKRKSANSLLSTLQLDRVRDEVFRQLEERRPIHPRELLAPVVAFVITFTFAFVMVFVGTKGEGILGSLMLSVVDYAASQRVWFNFENGFGYIEHYMVHAPLLSGLLGWIGFLVDQAFGYLFVVWHSFVPLYLDFVVFYYGYMGGVIVAAVR